MATPTVDLGRVSVLQEIIVRGGNVKAPGARAILQGKYEPDRAYTDVFGLSAVCVPRGCVARANWPARHGFRIPGSVGR